MKVDKKATPFEARPWGLLLAWPLPSPQEIIHAVYPSRRGQLPAVRALLDLLVAEFQALDED